ncbi:MAG: hypothetical protein ACRDT0_01865 [Pseudonocardiaceae bacterium]
MATATAPVAPAAGRTIAGYPSLSQQALGSLRFAWRKSHVDDDWTKGGEISDAWDRWSIFPWYMYPRYDLDWLTRLVALTAQQTPAWREPYTEIIHLMVERMTQYAAWFDLVEQKGLDPNRSQYPYAYYRDNIPPGWAGVYNAPGYYGNGLPVQVPPREARRTSPYTQPHAPPVGRTYNPDPIYANGGSYMMGKGYFLNMLGLYEVVSGDTKYDDPIKLVYDDEVQFEYTHEEVARVLFDQFMGDKDEGGTDLTPGIDCEVGKVFPWCVSVGGLGIRLTDLVHGTHYRPGYYRWLEWAKANLVGGNAKGGLYDWASIYYDRDIPYNMNHAQHQIPGNWFCCAYQYAPDDHEFAVRLYESAKRKFVIRAPDGSAHVNFPPVLGGGAEDLVGFGAAASCAWEFEDFETHAALMRWADAHYEPTWQDGEFYYQYGLGEEWPRGWPNDWLLLSFAGPPGSWVQMYTAPNLAKFCEPTVCDVDFPAVEVRQAVYSEDVAALIVAIGPNEGVNSQKEQITFRVKNLPGGRAREVIEDGNVSNNFDEVNPTEIVVKTSADRHHAFTIR